MLVFVSQFLIELLKLSGLHLGLFIISPFLPYLSLVDP